MNLIEQTEYFLNNQPSAGFFVNENFVFPDGVRLRDVMAQNKKYTLQDKLVLSEAAERGAAMRAAHRLVKAAKSPTLSDDGQDGFCGVDDLDDPHLYFNDGKINLDTGEVIKKRQTAYNTKVIFEVKRWADEYRVRTKTEMAVSQLPPEQSGERKTNSLTLAGARKISDSCRYVAKMRGGYSTFLTLTLDDAARERVANGETIQKQISRFWDAAKQMWRRGWVENHEGKEHRGSPNGAAPFDYCWVVENPKNEHGEDNPHVHIMMRWRVPYRDFAAWAARLERLWGQGFAHLEKIKEPEKAGAYMAKAAGYMTKGAEGEQGEVRGNRYGISSEARANGWEVLSIQDAGIMGALIADVHDHFLFEYGGKIAQRNRLKEMLDETPKDEKKKRQMIGKALEKVRTELNDSKAIPVRPSKYQLIMTGVDAFRSFMNWAKSKTGGVFTALKWLPRKENGVFWDEKEKPSEPFLREFKRRIWRGKADRIKGMCDEYWAAIRRDGVPHWVDDQDDFDDRARGVFDFVMA